MHAGSNDLDKSKYIYKTTRRPHTTKPVFLNIIIRYWKIVFYCRHCVSMVEAESGNSFKIVSRVEKIFVKRNMQVASGRSIHWPGIITIFPARKTVVSDIPAGDAKTANLFYSAAFVCEQSL
jgi:hypothetical protein